MRISARVRREVARIVGFVRVSSVRLQFISDKAAVRQGRIGATGVLGSDIPGDLSLTG